MFEESELKEQVLDFVDNHGVDTSRDILISLMIFAIFSLLINNTSGLPTVTSLTLFQVTTVGTLIAFIFYAAAEPKE